MCGAHKEAAEQPAGLHAGGQPGDEGVEGISNNKAYMVFIGLAALLLVMGVILAPSAEAAIDGYAFLLTHPALLDFDALHWAGNYGTAFLNAGVMLLIVLVGYRLTRTKLQGVQIASMMLVMGFAFYGKNPFNIWFPVLGVFLHAKLTRRHIAGAMATAWFSTSLSPVFNVTAFGTPELNPGSEAAVLIGVLLGVLAGYLVGVFAQYLPRLHKGRLLYNAGFAAGIVGMLINATKSGCGLGHTRYEYFAEHFVAGDNARLSLYMGVLFAYLILAGLALHGGMLSLKMLWLRCFGGDFIQEYGLGASLVNMGVIGICATLYVHLTVVGHLNGPVIAAIWTAVGFAAAGVTLRTFLPSMAGVYLMAFLSGGVGALVCGGEFLQGALEKVGSRSMILAALFSCGFAPAVGAFGPLAGLFLGALHSLLTPLTASLHGWMALTNNGFSIGIIIVFMYPIYARLKLGKKARGARAGPEG